MKIKTTVFAALMAATAFTGAAKAQEVEELVVAFFPDWPTPNQYAQANDIYDEEVGIPVKWVSFDTGTAMSAAMASGDVHIAFSQGVTPFLVATAAGQNLVAVDIAVTYSDNDNCVVREALEIDATNASELAGKKVAVPLGTAAHSGYLAQMKHFGVDPDSMEIVDMSPADGAAAFANVDSGLDMVCGWGGNLARMKEYGNVLLSGKEKEDVVGRVFDLTSTPSTFAEENAELLSKFLSVTAKMNAMYAENRDPMLEDIAKMAGMDMDGAIDNLDVFGFPTVEEQLSDSWMNGWLAGYLKEAADSLESDGKIEALDDYNALIDTSYLEAASNM